MFVVVVVVVVVTGVVLPHFLRMSLMTRNSMKNLMKIHLQLQLSGQHFSLVVVHLMNGQVLLMFLMTYQVLFVKKMMTERPVALEAVHLSACEMHQS